jgi:hypothetical protein
VVKFGVAHGWRRIRLADGSVVDLPDDALAPPSVNPRRGSLVQFEAAMLRKLLEQK